MHTDHARRALAIAALTTATANATNVYRVDDDAPPGGDGATWQTAFNDLQDALDAAHAALPEAFEIRIAEGTYLPDRGTGNQSLSFTIDIATAGGEVQCFEFDRDLPVNEDEPVGFASLPDGGAVGSDTVVTSAMACIPFTAKLLGGFAGLNHPDPDTRDPGQFVSVLSGDLRGDDNGLNVRFDNSESVLVIDAENGANCLVDGVVIQGGTAMEYGSAVFGSAICAVISDSYLVLSRSTVQSNLSSFSGCVELLFPRPGTAQGAIVFNSVFRENDGGCVTAVLPLPHELSPRVSVIDCDFRQNTDGVAPVEMLNVLPTIRDSVFLDNLGGRAGAVWIELRSNETAGIQRSLMRANESWSGVGAISAHSNLTLLGTLVVENRNVFANSIPAVEHTFGSLKLVGSTVANNRVYGSSQIQSSNSVLAIGSIVYSEQLAPGTGVSTTGSRPPLNDRSEASIILGFDVAAGDPNDYVGVLDTNPLFEVSGRFGVRGDYHPRADSPAVDMGTPRVCDLAGAFGCPLTDLDGTPRGGVLPFGTPFDIGALEALDSIPPRCDADFAIPLLTLNIDDVLGFLSAYADQRPEADLAPPLGDLNIDDVLAFLASFAAGCP